MIRCSDQERLQIGRTDSHQRNILPARELDSTLSASGHPRRSSLASTHAFTASARVRCDAVDGCAGRPEGRPYESVTVKAERATPPPSDARVVVRPQAKR